jgi:hypothetical protein
MDMVLGISMAPTMVRLVLIEGENADGVTVEEDHFAVAARTEDVSVSGGATDRVTAAVVGTLEGATEGGHRLASIGVTWTDPVEVDALRDAIAAHDVGGVMLISPLLAAAALAREVGDALGYQHIAMLYVERDSATLADVAVPDGSMADLRRQPLAGDVAAELCLMVAGLDAPGSRADAVFVVGCDSDVLEIKAALEGATALPVIAPEEPDMALARGAALASANAPLFASSTVALAYSLDPAAVTPNYVDFAVDDEISGRRRPLVLLGSAAAALVAGLAVISLPSDYRPAPSPSAHAGGVASADRAPAPEAPPPAPALAAPPAPTPEAAAPPAAAPPGPAPEVPAPEVVAAPAPPPQVVAPEAAPTAPAPQVAAPAPAPPPRRVPPRRAPQSVPSPVQQAPAPPPPAAPPPPPAAPPPPPGQYPPYQPPPRTFYIRLPFIPVLIPIHPGAPPPPAPPPPGP